jgi:hypothetical protein
MTSHELAALLLSKPDESVYIWKYTGGDDELMEVEDVTVYEDRYTAPKLVLQVYKEPKP